MSSETCAGKPRLECIRAVEAFNAGDYYAAHEWFEILWRREEGALRDFYQGLLQIGVAVHHELNGNRAGSRNLITRGIERVVPFAPDCLGLALQPFLTVCRELEHHIMTQPPLAGGLPPGRTPLLTWKKREGR